MSERALPISLDTCPADKVARFRHWASNPRSQKGAIALKCLDCVAWEREEVRRCHIVACPLHPFRPYR